MRKSCVTLFFVLCSLMFLWAQSFNTFPVSTQKPPLHGKHWMAITGKPLAATAGATVFIQGGNAVDASCAMLAATCTMWDVLGWGGETQALIYHPVLQQVIAVNALGVAPTGATSSFFRDKGLKYPPQYGALAAITPGTPGGLLVILAEFGTMSLKEVLAPAVQLASGYPIDAQTAHSIEREKDRIREWPYSARVFLTHRGDEREAPYPGEIFVQTDLLLTLHKLIDAEQQALTEGKSRKEAIYAAYDRFYTGDIAQEFVRGCREQGGLLTMSDLKNWKVIQEEPVTTNYRGVDIYKLREWTQGPVLLQTLNILENFDLKAMGYNTSTYIHTVYQAMNLSYADRDFYYGDPYLPPEEPIRGLLSKTYARERSRLITAERNNPAFLPGDPYPYEGKSNPWLHYLKATQRDLTSDIDEQYYRDFVAGTTSVIAADTSGWVVSMTPSGGWIPACIAGNTGIGMSQRMQSFVLDPAENPFNVVAPGKRPRVTLTPSLALKDGKPYLAFAKQGGDEQDQLLLQFFLNIAEFGMTVQEACESAGFISHQMFSSFGDHIRQPGSLVLNSKIPEWTRSELQRKGYTLQFRDRTSGPVNAILFDWSNGAFWGGSSNHGEDYGIGW